MPRTYKRKLGTRNYRNYSAESVEAALKKVVDEDWSLRRAAAYHKIPFATLNNKFHGRHINKNGGQSVFSEMEERSFINAAGVCGEWGFPLTLTDLRHLAKNYLDKQGRNVAKFKENVPGIDWAYSLLQRHKDELSQKVAANIKRARANVSRETVINYFDNLLETLKDIPACRIFNYDETNLQDDPGKKQMLFRRGTKYPERICNFTKSSISLMMCGSASGVLLPPYVIYKAEKMWAQWTEHGPKGDPCCSDRCCAAGSRYNRTQHGWIDGQSFTDWFMTCFLPHAKRLPGRKVLLGDNLSSHFTESVIQQCKENDISFVCLPKNATHLTQPLDVGFFRPFKLAWRSVLYEWKKVHPHHSSVDKKDFPHLLCSTLNRMNTTTQDAIKKDLVSSFKATGIVPFDPEQVLRKIPGGDNQPENAVNNILVNYLQQQRFTAEPSRRNIKRQKLTVEPGKSVTAVSSDSEEEINDTQTNDNSDNESIEDLRGEVEAETEYYTPDKNQLENGNFVLVKIFGGNRKKTQYRYVGIVQKVTEEQGNGIELQGLKAVGQERKMFAVVQGDEFLADLSDILAILPHPKSSDIDGKIMYLFEKPIDVYEIK